MKSDFILVTVITLVAVVIYVLATIANTAGLIFLKERAERMSHRLAGAGLLVHGAAILLLWKTVGHGPYITRHEVLSSGAWVMLFLFLLFCRWYPSIRPASIFMFPATFLFLALGLFFNPVAKKLPPTLKSVWLVLHVCFYKISLGTILIALAFSLFYILKKRFHAGWLQRLPDMETLDLLAYRFAGFGFTFWAIAMLAGSIWAYQSWGRFWGWDPVESWSLITWVSFGIYLHLRRFFRWSGERASYFYVVCFFLSLTALFFTPLIDSSVHSEYFK